MIRFAKYFVVGGLSAIVDFVIFAALVKLAGWPWYIAGSISFVAATLLNYILSVKHVFTSGTRFAKRDEVALTFLVSGIGFAINQAALFLLIREGLAALLAKIGATAVVFAWNYLARLRFVFKEKRPAIDR